MQTQKAYAALASELERASHIPTSDLIALADGAPRARTLDIDGAMVEIELSASWLDQTRKSVRVTASARGPSTWHTERQEESITILVPTGAPSGA